jgi:hypothetical protein
MCILKKEFPLCWDEASQHSFDALKCALTPAPLLKPPSYGKDLLLYVVSAESIIDMVLVQENDALDENIIYYLRRGLVGLELNYSRVEKLALAVVHVVQRLYHYILLHKTIVIVIINPFQYVLM